MTFSECQNGYYVIKGRKMESKVGVIKEIDKLGRIVIPKEMRDRLAFGTSVEVMITDEGVLIRNP